MVFNCANNSQLSSEEMTQFILNPTSMNLDSRIHPKDSSLPEIIQKCRDYCYVTVPSPEWGQT